MTQLEGHLVFPKGPLLKNILKRPDFIADRADARLTKKLKREGWGDVSVSENTCTSLRIRVQTPTIHVKAGRV